MSELYISIDESGTFASSDENFILGGYCILGAERYRGKMRKYENIEQLIASTHEIKGNELESGEQQILIAAMESANSFAIGVKNKNLPAKCFSDNLTKALIKDDILKNLLIEVISQYELSQLSKIVIEIDEQNLKFGIRQNLYTALYKVLISGYYNRNQYIKGLATSDLLLAVTYVDSKTTTSVRAADVLVNIVNKKIKYNEDVYSILKIFKAL